MAANTGNPFYVQPLGGMGPEIGRTLQGIGQTMQANREAEAARMREEEAQKAAMDALRSGDPSKMAEVSIKFPGISENLERAFGYSSEATRPIVEQTYSSVLANPERAIEYLQQGIAGVEAKGGNPQNMRRDLQAFMSDPASALKAVEMGVAGMAPKVYEAYKSQSLGEDMTANQKDYLLAKKEGFKGTFMDFKQALSADPKSGLEVLKLQTQILDIQDRINQRKTESERTAKLEDKKTRGLVKNIDGLVDTVDKAIGQAKDFSATGIPGAVTADIPGSPALKLRKTVATVQANLGFDKLQQMRDASPTGGALGAVSERELDLLQSTIANLDPNAGEEQLVENLNKVKEHYSNWKRTLLGETPSGGANLSIDELVNKYAKP